MKRLIPWLFLPLLAAGLQAEELPSREGGKTAGTRAADPVSGVPWIGLNVGPLDAATRAHAPQVPEGVGFLVVSVEPEGPASAAGIEPFDIVWRYGEQLLVNEAQFSVLLRMNVPGDVVKVTVVRRGEVREAEVTLAAQPERREVRGIRPTEIPLMPTGMLGMPWTKVYPLTRTAELTREDGGVARLRYEDDELVVEIQDAEGALVYQGPVRKDGKWLVPEEWSCPVGALMRSLYRAERSEPALRTPRPRVVMPARSNRD